MDQPRTRTIGITEFLRWDDEHTLLLSPKFQRRRIWPKKAKAFLIDTILHGMPIPKIFMRQQLDLRGNRTIHEVVDGQQRLRAVLDFKNDDFSLSRESEPWGAVTYSQLPPSAQRAFMSYEFSVDLLIDASDADVLDIFARINSHAVPLNAQEKRNAAYFGSFKRTIYSLALKHLEFWKKHQILSDRTIARMKEAELTSELIVAMIDGFQDKKKSLNGFYGKWDDRFPYKAKSTARFQEVLDLIDQHLGEALVHSHFRRPALFYSTFLALYQLRYGALGDLDTSRSAFGTSEGQRFKAALDKLDHILSSKRPPIEYNEFVVACQRQTDNIKPRRLRNKFILQEFKGT